MIGFIGFGHVGKAFAAHLLRLGEPDIGYYDPFVALSCAIGEGGNTYTQSGSIEELVVVCDILFLTVADDVIESVATGISSSDFLKGKLFIHTSGAHSVNVLRTLQDKGAEVASIHPLMAFNDHESALSGLSTCYLTVEGAGNSQALQGLLALLGNPILHLEGENKALYHAGACVVSNYLTVVLAYGVDLIKRATGETGDQVWQAITPLIESALRNIAVLGVENALTGPLNRQDVQTVVAHYDSLKTDENPQLYHQLVAATIHYMKDYHYPHDKLRTLDKNVSIEAAFESILEPVSLSFEGKAHQFNPNLFDIKLMQFDKAIHVPPHSHGSQLGIVLEGSICLIVEGVKRYYVKGDVYTIQAGQIHEAYIESGYRDMSLFAKLLKSEER